MPGLGFSDSGYGVDEPSEPRKSLLEATTSQRHQEHVRSEFRFVAARPLLDCGGDGVNTGQHDSGMLNPCLIARRLALLRSRAAPQIRAGRPAGHGGSNRVFGNAVESETVVSQSVPTGSRSPRSSPSCRTAGAAEACTRPQRGDPLHEARSGSCSGRDRVGSGSRHLGRHSRGHSVRGLRILRHCRSGCGHVGICCIVFAHDRRRAPLRRRSVASVRRRPRNLIAGQLLRPAADPDAGNGVVDTINLFASGVGLSAQTSRYFVHSERGKDGRRVEF